MRDYRPRSSYESNNVPWSKAVSRRAVRPMLGPELRTLYERALYEISQDLPHEMLTPVYVPEFRTKMDLVPGMVSYVWFIPAKTGTFEILCAELCGNGHFNMRGKVVVQEESEYQAWLQKQKTFAQLSARAKQTKATQ